MVQNSSYREIANQKGAQKMRFDEALAIATQSADVEGIPKRFGKIVRRRVPAGYISHIKKRKKKKKKEEDEV
jgi:hypothetical protein